MAATVTSEITETSTYRGDNVYEFRRDIYSGGLGTGVRAVAGVDLQINEHVTLFLEGSLSAVQFFPKHKELTRYVVGNEDRLASLLTPERETRYVKEISYNTNDNRNPEDHPTEEIRFSLLMSAFRPVMGFRFFL